MWNVFTIVFSGSNLYTTPPGIHPSGLVTRWVINSLQSVNDLVLKLCKQQVVLCTIAFRLTAIHAVSCQPVHQLLIVRTHFIKIGVCLNELADAFRTFRKEKASDSDLTDVAEYFVDNQLSAEERSSVNLETEVLAAEIIKKKSAN